MSKAKFQIIIEALGSSQVNAEFSKIKKAFKGVQDATHSIGSALTSLKGLAITGLAGWGIKNLTQSFIEAGSTTENYKVRLGHLLGSIEEGNRLFKDMAEYAGKVPFEYEQIMGAATQLAGIMKGGVDEVKQWMPMIGDLAAVSGLSIEETTGQVVRMYSAGAASADLFRERGITAMLGFQTGVSYSAEETRKILMASWNDTNSKFKGATADLANIWDGKMSMLKDGWFQFKEEVSKSGLMDAAKTAIDLVLKKMSELKESGDLKKWAEAIGAAFVKTIEFITQLVGYVQQALPFVKAQIAEFKLLWDVMKAYPQGVIDFFINLNTEMKKTQGEVNKLTSPTPFQRFWAFLGQWGKDILIVFEFMGRAFGNLIAAVLIEMYEMLEVLANGLAGIGEMIWGALSGNLDTIKQGLNDFTTAFHDFEKDTSIMGKSMFQSLGDSWEDMRSKFQDLPELNLPAARKNKTSTSDLITTPSTTGDIATSGKSTSAYDIIMAATLAAKKAHNEEVKKLDEQAYEETKKLMEQISSDHNERFNTALELLDADYAAKLEKLEGHEQAKKELTEIYLAERAELEKEDQERKYEEWKTGLDDMSLALVEWTEQIPSWGEAIGDMLTGIFDTVASGIGNAVARAIVYQEDLGKALESLLKNIAASIIQTLIQTGIQRLITSLIFKATGLAEHTSRMGQLAAQTFGSAFAATAAIPIVGPAMAPGVAAASVTAMLTGAGVSQIAGMAFGGGTGSAHAGLDYVPEDATYVLKRGEAVLAPEQNRDLKEFLKSGGSGQGIIQHITNNYFNGELVDLDQLARKLVIPNQKAIEDVMGT